MLQWLMFGVSVLAYLDAKEHREWERRSLSGAKSNDEGVQG